MVEGDREKPGGAGDDAITALRKRARVTADRIVLGLAFDPDEVIALGVDLLVAGHDGPGIVELASLPQRSLWSDVEPVARLALVEVGLWPPDRHIACWELARHWAEGLQAGGSQTFDRAAALWGLWSALGDPPEIGILVELMDEWEAALPDERGAIESEMSRMAAPIISAADRALATRR